MTVDNGTWTPSQVWRRFRLEAEAAKNYPSSYALYMGQTHRNVLLEALLPTLLYIKAVAILDDSLDLWLERKRASTRSPIEMTSTVGFSISATTASLKSVRSMPFEERGIG